MPRQPKPDPERLETLEQRLAKEQLDLRLAREKEQASLNDARRKIIVGALMRKPLA
jgi:hypothetical protein